MNVMTQVGEILMSVMTKIDTRNDYICIVYINNKTFIFRLKNEKNNYICEIIFLLHTCYISY